MVKNRYKISLQDYGCIANSWIFIQNEELLPTGISFPQKYPACRQVFPRQKEKIESNSEKEKIVNKCLTIPTTTVDTTT